MNLNSKIFVFGHNGMVGSAIVRKLKEQLYTNIQCDPNIPRLDLTKQKNVEYLFNEFQPEYVFIAAAKVGGIYANSTYPAQFIYNNLAIQTNIIETARQFQVKKLLMLGSSCIFSRQATQPMIETDLLSGPLEPTNEYYAIAKIAGIKMCEAYYKEYGCNFISCQPTNLWGPHDSYDLNNSHVLPAMIRKIHEAKINNQPVVILWGTGSPLREFLHVDDLAEACVFLMHRYNDMSLINVGSGKEISIKELSEIIKDIIGYAGKIIFDKTKPDGMPRKLLNCSKILGLGWKPKIGLIEGIKNTYQDFLLEYDKLCQNQH